MRALGGGQDRDRYQVGCLVLLFVYCLSSCVNRGHCLTHQFVPGSDGVAVGNAAGSACGEPARLPVPLVLPLPAMAAPAAKVVNRKLQSKKKRKMKKAVGRKVEVAEPLVNLDPTPMPQLLPRPVCQEDLEQRYGLWSVFWSDPDGVYASEEMTGYSGPRPSQDTVCFGMVLFSHMCGRWWMRRRPC